uniref:hypothetical protein n=1 Tax=uncultured Parvibaculum sp. TaxID=291828 RepID=UPI0030DBA172
TAVRDLAESLSGNSEIRTKYQPDLGGIEIIWFFVDFNTDSEKRSKNGSQIYLCWLYERLPVAKKSTPAQRGRVHRFHGLDLF